MSRRRDSQRTRVYAWENGVVGGARIYSPTFVTLEEVDAYLRPIWRSERGRYGRAKVPAPTLSRNLWGSRRATANPARHELKMPRWSRNEWCILHEMAHLLTPRDEAHGPRFVGVLIGLAARHLGRDPQELVDAAVEGGVRVDVRSIGACPRILGSDRLAKLLPCSVMEAAVELGVSWRVIHGYALNLTRAGRARFFRGKIVAVVEKRVEPRPIAS